MSAPAVEAGAVAAAVASGGVTLVVAWVMPTARSSMSIGLWRSRIAITASKSCPGTPVTVTTLPPLDRVLSYTAWSVALSPPNRLDQKPWPAAGVAVAPAPA